MAFYDYNQNNSGGAFEGDYKHIIIEAANADEADRRAESEAGIYFDGCDNGADCHCCGDRWSRAYGGGDPEPMIYGTPVSKRETKFDWGLKNLVIYADGRHEVV